MAAAAAPYAGWLAAAAAQSQGAAGQALAVVSAFEAAQAATIHPGAVDANRNAFVNLIMTNLFGQNAPAIALAESIYEEMWAQDVSAMASYYSGAAAAAAKVVPWQSVLQSFPALAGGIASGLSGAAGGGGGGGTAGAAGGGGGASGGGGAPPGTTGTEGAAAAGGGGGGGVGSADSGLAPASYTGGDAGAYTGGAAAGTDVGSAAATSANPGVASSGVGGFGMMPMPMGLGTRSAGLLGDGPSMSVPAKAEEKEEEAAAVEEATAEAEGTAETPEPEVPAMSVLPTAVPDAAAAAAPGEAKPAAQPAAGASRIPASGFRASDAVTEEAEESVATLRPKIAPGEFRPRAEEEEEARVQIPGA